MDTLAVVDQLRTQVRNDREALQAALEKNEELTVRVQDLEASLTLACLSQKNNEETIRHLRNLYRAKCDELKKAQEHISRIHAQAEQNAMKLVELTEMARRDEARRLLRSENLEGRIREIQEEADRRIEEEEARSRMNEEIAESVIKENAQLRRRVDELEQKCDEISKEQRIDYERAECYREELGLRE